MPLPENLRNPQTVPQTKPPKTNLDLIDSLKPQERAHCQLAEVAMEFKFPNTYCQMSCAQLRHDSKQGPEFLEILDHKEECWEHTNTQNHSHTPLSVCMCNFNVLLEGIFQPLVEATHAESCPSLCTLLIATMEPTAPSPLPHNALRKQRVCSLSVCS